MGLFGIGGGKKTVLIADDDKRIVRLIKAVLNTNRKIRVITASNGSAGLSKARREKPNLVLLDVQMPKLNGTEVCKALKAERETRRLKVILISGVANLKKMAKQAGADGHLPKPIDPAELSRKIGTWI